ncbi:HAMP domain-containing protein [Rheinheimera sp. D18]|uniref:methyl-accepting chemotaxis protein n=1 Tax=Rheinheimera sp. D18 TaxID=2545632 RepID=UPI0010535687|nr:methyl-accepting chemotaxis protein [Rheinheimera sp. D18]QBL09692.1 HAMP domain-containing protein [Rheinheimera sp. D18]
MAQFVRNLSISQKLMLLLFLPVVIALWLLVSQLTQSWQQVSLAQHVRASIDTSVVTNHLVSALQAERGASGVFLASSGNKLKQRVVQLRQQSDQQLQAFFALKQPQLQAAQQQLQQLSALRSQVDKLAITGALSAERYTALISALINVNQKLESEVTHLGMAQQLATLNQFTQMKERAGRERAILGEVFNRGSANSALLARVSSNMGAFNAYYENFTRMLSPVQLSAWQQLSQHNSFTEVTRLQQLTTTSPLEQSLQVDGGQWFDLATLRLAKMSEFEQLLSQHIVAEAMQLYQQAQRKLWLFALAIVLIVSLLATVATITVRSIAEAVHSIETTIIALSQRNLTVRSNYASKDEFGRIAQSTNTMAQELQRILNEIGAATAQIATAAEESSAVTLQTSKGVQQQQQDTEMVATAMHEMSATVRDVASSTAEAAELSETVQQGSADGQTKLEQTIKLIERLSAQVDSTATVIDSVKHDSEAIASVLDVIRGIADQTNLLALNAAIEAARAGEQGRGFAVVADEVRTLAQRTAQSTGDIQRMIEVLQQGAIKASDAMRLSLDQAHEGSDKVAETGEILASVLLGINSINDKNMQIASAAEQQSTVAEDINRKILSISDVAAQTSAGATQMASTSHELADLAEQLQMLVNRFKLA